MIAITGTSHNESQIADTRNARATVGRACSGNSSPSRLSPAPSVLPPGPCSPTWKALEPRRAPTKPIMPAASTIKGNGTPRKKMPKKAAAASTSIARLLSARLPAAVHRLEHDREHRRFQAEEERHHGRHTAEGGIDVAQTHDGDDAGHDEEPARNNGARPAVHQPADIDGELVRLRAG